MKVWRWMFCLWIKRVQCIKCEGRELEEGREINQTKIVKTNIKSRTAGQENGELWDDSSRHISQVVNSGLRDIAGDLKWGHYFNTNWNQFLMLELDKMKVWRLVLKGLSILLRSGKAYSNQFKKCSPDWKLLKSKCWNIGISKIDF